MTKSYLYSILKTNGFSVDIMAYSLCDAYKKAGVLIPLNQTLTPSYRTYGGCGLVSKLYKTNKSSRFACERYLRDTEIRRLEYYIKVLERRLDLL